MMTFSVIVWVNVIDEASVGVIRSNDVLLLLSVRVNVAFTMTGGTEGRDGEGVVTAVISSGNTCNTPDASVSPNNDPTEGDGAKNVGSIFTSFVDSIFGSIVEEDSIDDDWLIVGSFDLSITAWYRFSPGEKREIPSRRFNR